MCDRYRWGRSFVLSGRSSYREFAPVGIPSSCQPAVQRRLRPRRRPARRWAVPGINVQAFQGLVCGALGRSAQPSARHRGSRRTHPSPGPRPADSRVPSPSGEMLTGPPARPAPLLACPESVNTMAGLCCGPCVGERRRRPLHGPNARLPHPRTTSNWVPCRLPAHGRFWVSGGRGRDRRQHRAVCEGASKGASCGSLLRRPPGGSDQQIRARARDQVRGPALLLAASKPVENPQSCKSFNSRPAVSFR
jgi:hypothetical protein